jgi:hypothetical protein
LSHNPKNRLVKTSNLKTMKALSITAFVLSMLSSAAFAQEVAGETPTATEDSVEVVITPKKGQDSTIVKVAGMKIIVLNDNKNISEIIIDEEVDGENAGSNDDDDDDNDDKVSHWAGIRLGVNGYVTSAGTPEIPSVVSFLELDYAKSVSWDLNLLEKDFRLYKNNVELVTGLGLHFANYAFKSKVTTLNNTDPLTAYADSNKVLEKNKLKVTYLTAPLMIGFSTNQDEDKAFRLAVGGQVSWRIGSRLKQRYSIQGETYKPKIKSDYDLNPLLIHATASVGYGPVNIYANYGLNNLFEKNKTIDLTPFDVGVQFMF